MFQESFSDAAIIVHNILNQPLSIPETDKDITLLSAAISFNESGVPDSYLSQIMQTFIIYPGPTETLIRELELLSEDLNSSL
jgi:hypothetical protein